MSQALLVRDARARSRSVLASFNPVAATIGILLQIAVLVMACHGLTFAIPVYMNDSPSFYHRLIVIVQSGADERTDYKSRSDISTA